VDVRVIAATNRDLARGVESGEFREDLFFRLNVFPIHCPPLRERPEDIPVLASHFLRKYSAKIGRQTQRIPPAAMKTLEAYHWPGNVRELENVIERAVILSGGPDLALEEALPAHPPHGAQSDQHAHSNQHSQSRGGAGAVTLKEIEKQSIQEALEQCNWKIEGEKGAASRLSLPPSSLRSRMKKLGIRKPSPS
jgi:transcriptional regulator with GAF, ATPase, and Fis domain